MSAYSSRISSSDSSIVPPFLSGETRPIPELLLANSRHENTLHARFRLFTKPFRSGDDAQLEAQRRHLTR
jgi:hypothetical protein